VTEGEIETGRDSGGQAATGGGHKPAPDIDSNMMANKSIALDERVDKVVDLETFRRFAQVMAGRHQNGSLSREDALSMIASVAKARKLHETYGDDQVCAIIEGDFNRAVDPQDLDYTEETRSDPISFPGVITADQLQTKTFEPVMFVVPPILAEGVTLLVGKPKSGKSWLVLDVARAVAKGTTVLGTMQAQQANVLGLFLEDSERRLQTRLSKLYGNSLELWPRTLAFKTEWRRLDEGGLDDLEAWCQQVAGPKLIIIDTLAPVRSSKGSRRTQYDIDYESLSGLHKIAHKYQVAIIVVHHSRKADADDIFDTVSGTNGLTGAADSILVLSKRSGKAVLHARGRDIEESETALKFDPADCRWVALGDASEVFVSDERSRIQAALDNAPEPMSPKELMLATGIKKRNALDILLHKMVRNGQIGKAGHGKYVNSGKIGKKDPAGEQTPDEANKISASANLSDLSGKEDPGGAADERTTP
jgi:AAA domain